MAGGQGSLDEFRGIDLLFGEAEPATLEADKVVKLGREGQQGAAAIEDMAAPELEGESYEVGAAVEGEAEDGQLGLMK